MQPEPYVDCGHDLEAFARQEAELATMRAERDQAQRDFESVNVSAVQYAEWLEDTRDELAQARADVERLGRDAHDRERAGIAWMRAVASAEADRDRIARERDGVRDELARMAGDLEDARLDRDRLADTVRRQQPVIDAAKAWYAKPYGPFRDGDDHELAEVIRTALDDAGPAPDPPRTRDGDSTDEAHHARPATRETEAGDG